MMQGRRTMVARGLLAVLVSMLVLTGLHRHPQGAAVAAVVCDDCTQGLHHTGHISTTGGNATDCPLCHFLGIFYTLAATLLAGAAVRPTPAHVSRPATPLCGAAITGQSTRAPPQL